MSTSTHFDEHGPAVLVDVDSRAASGIVGDLFLEIFYVDAGPEIFDRRETEAEYSLGLVVFLHSMLNAAAWFRLRAGGTLKIVLLGEEVGITLTVRVVCAGERIPVHVVLVVDGSAPMAGTPTQQTRQAAASLVRGLGLRDSLSVMVGVVEFNTSARTLTLLTSSEERAIRAVKGRSRPRSRRPSGRRS